MSLRALPAIVLADLQPLVLRALRSLDGSNASAVVADASLDAPLWNPLNISLVTFLFLTVVKSCAEEALSFVIVQILRLADYPKLPSRVPVPMMKGLEKLQAKDYLFLFLNQFVEMYFVVHLFALMFKLPMRPDQATLLNTVGAFYLTFLVDDFIYYWAHRFMHLPAVYPWCHKHHHRQALPSRGYLDAANEHPMEQVVGLGAVWIALHIVVPLTGFHALAVLMFFVAYASLAMLNHTPYDVQLSWLLLGYSVRAHEMHHRIPRSNYAQNTMIFDHLLSTFQPYMTPTPKEITEEVKAKEE